MMVRRAAGFALAALRDPAARQDLLVAATLASSDDTNVRAALDAAIRALDEAQRGPV